MHRREADQFVARDCQTNLRLSDARKRAPAGQPVAGRLRLPQESHPRSSRDAQTADDPSRRWDREQEGIESRKWLF
jgi:hypothetical protein